MVWKLACEAWSYRSVVLDWRLRRYVFRDFLDGFCHPIRYYMDLQMVRHHGWSEPGVGAVLFFASYTKLFATPLYWKGVEWYGHYSTYMFVFRAIYFLWMFGFLLGPLSDKSTIIVHYLLALMEGGLSCTLYRHVVPLLLSCSPPTAFRVLSGLVIFSLPHRPSWKKVAMEPRSIFWTRDSQTGTVS